MAFEILILVFEAFVSFYGSQNDINGSLKNYSKDLTYLQTVNVCSCMCIVDVQRDGYVWKFYNVFVRLKVAGL